MRRWSSLGEEVVRPRLLPTDGAADGELPRYPTLARRRAFLPPRFASPAPNVLDRCLSRRPDDEFAQLTKSRLTKGSRPS